VQVDDNNKIVIKRIARNEKTGSAEETVHVFRPGRAGRWLIYLLLIHAFMIMAVLGVFFFTAFLALFVVAAAALGFRLWWLRRKMPQSTDTSEGEYLVIEDAEIVEERTAKADDVNAAKKPDEQDTKDKKGNKE
jgi:hypothetical protein